jgi:serine/threonine-protein kinase
MIASGTRLGAYEIVSLLGAGGMGEVYRARDTKLKRDVALKVLPDLLSSDPERLARFQREAELLATLNHPNIAAIYGIEDDADGRAIVLELVEGETLAERIARGPIPIEESLTIARQVVDALESAHDRGVVHRDLKPANIKITPAGIAKILDFGLAAMSQDSGPQNVNVTNSPTLTMAATRAGVIMGTAAYMSPEQATGQTADKRADIWAFGVVLWEMLTGKPAFEGETLSHTLAFVITKEPDWRALPERTPRPIQKLLQRCLEKDRKRRLQAIGDTRFELEEAKTHQVDEQGALRDMQIGGRRMLPWLVTGVAVTLAGIGLVALSPWRPLSPPPGKVELTTELSADLTPPPQTGGAAVILSPDGRTVVFSGSKSGARPQLYVRRLDQLEAVPLSGTDGAGSPFFSPDGQWLAFFADGKLKKVPISGGGAQILCDATNGRGGTWDTLDQITFSPQNVAPLVRVSATGGTPAQLTALGKNEVAHRWPQALPGGKAVLYTAQSNGVGYGAANAFVQPLPTGAPKLVQRGAYYSRYVSSGHLLFIRDGNLFVAPFDLDRLQVTGPTVPLLEGVVSNRFGGAQFDVSGNGTLVYLPGHAVRDEVSIQWMSRDGKLTPLRATPTDWSNILFAPDGRRLAVDIADGKQTEVWVYEWARDTLSRVTFLNDAQKPVWTPDGQRVAFVSTRGTNGALNLFWQRADGTGEVQRLTESPFSQGVWSFHPSGKFLAYHENNPETRDDILILPIDGDELSGWKPGKPAFFLKTPFAERAPMFSPDGRWLAYQSTDTGRDEVYVRPFPSGGGKWQISTDGGILPTWSRTKHELFYGTPDQRIMVVPYTVEGDSFRAEKPRVWSEGRFLPRQRTGPNRSFDLSPDGTRFALAPIQESQTPTKQDRVVFIFNLFDELRRIAPAK